MNRSNSTSGSPTPSSPTRSSSASTQSTVSSPLLGPEPIHALAPAARERLRSLLAARAAMLPISVGYDMPQQPADPWAIFELRKSGDVYTLMPTAAGPSLVPAADGIFIYVVRADDPGRVYVGVPYGRVGIHAERFWVEGHTSLSEHTDVLYAGEIVLQRGRLVSWGNSSGHYQPGANLRHRNLLPITQTLLPQAKFSDYWRASNTGWLTQFAQMQGYADIIDAQAKLGRSRNEVSPGHTHTPAAAQAQTAGEVSRMRLRVGGSEMTLEYLIDLGAAIDDQPLLTALRQPTAPTLLQTGLPARLGFDGDTLRGQILARRIAGIEHFLFELACQRIGDAPIVIDRGGRGQRPWITKINALLTRVQTLSAMAVHEPRQNTVICLLPGDAPIRYTALGLHLFGLYNGLRALHTAVADGDLTGGIIAGSELAATGIGAVAEQGVQRMGAAVQRGGVHNLSQFARTAIATHLGGPARLGATLVRGAPLVGSIITAPFDAYHAINSVRLAAQSEGRQADDHYVDAALAGVSFITTAGLGVAAYAGLASAGALGLAAGALLVVVGRAYHSVRYVENLQVQVPLSMGEVVSTGLLSFIGMSPPQNVQDRLTVSQAAHAYRGEMRQRLQSSLAHLAQLGVSQIVFGDARIELRPPRRRTESVLRGTPAGNVETTRVIEVPQPPIVIGNSGDDAIDAWRGLDGLDNVVHTACATDDKVLWVTGTGDDTLVGVRDQSNLFEVRAGKKTIKGGIEPDRFELQAVPGQDSNLDGGLGDDTLLLSFAHPATTPLDVALAGHLWRDDFRHREDHAGDNYQAAGCPDWQTYPRDLPGPPMRLAYGWIDVDGRTIGLKSVENVITSSAATTRILGNGQDNLFVLNGCGDSVEGGLGDDTYIIQGGGTVRVKAGAGSNRYQLQRNIGAVEIDGARAGLHTLYLDFYLHELLFEAWGTSLHIISAGNTRQRIVLQDMYRILDGGRGEAVRPDDRLRVMTRDAMAVTPLLSRGEDGLVELLAKPLTDLALQGQDRFATAQEIQHLDQLVAMSGGWHTDTTMAPAVACGNLPSPGNETMLGATASALA